MTIDPTKTVPYLSSGPQCLKLIKDKLNSVTTFFEHQDKEFPKFPDPMYTVVQLGLIDKPQTKIGIEGTSIFIQKPGISQSVSRWLNSQNRNDLKKLKYSLIKATEWFPVEDNENLAIIYNRAIVGLLILRETYEGSDDFVEEGLDNYINVLSSALEAEELPKEYLAYKEKFKHTQITIHPNKVEKSTALLGTELYNEQLTSKKELLWDTHTINSISDLFRKIRDSIKEESKETGKKAIHALIENIPEKFEGILNDIHCSTKNYQ